MAVLCFASPQSPPSPAHVPPLQEEGGSLLGSPCLLTEAAAIAPLPPALLGQQPTTQCPDVGGMNHSVSPELPTGEKRQPGGGALLPRSCTLSPALALPSLWEEGGSLLRTTCPPRELSVHLILLPCSRRTYFERNSLYSKATAIALLPTPGCLKYI